MRPTRLKSRLKRGLLTAALVVLALFAGGCAQKDPLARLEKELADYPEYTVILEDMKEGGNFTDNFYHHYKIVFAEPGSEAGTALRDRTEDWVEVSEEFYRRYEPYLGMAVLTKEADQPVEKTQQPPGYQYVGNPTYGTWKTDPASGNSFWEFYGKYALMSHIFGSFRQPVYRDEWADFRSARERREPYFGQGRRFGTQGTYTQTTHKSFYERQLARQQAKKQSFADKVKSRIKTGRTERSTMSSTRSRSSGSRGGK